jgi:catechol 2,3-dioxygenase-like lactoylglutathione lyase family enzyme
MQATVHLQDGTRHEGEGKIHFGWALEGRAILDVWILPGVFYGSTLRVYDPTIDAWHILWSDPLRQYYVDQIGRADGKDIVQEGKDSTGATVRWRFTERTPGSFRWIGEALDTDTKKWILKAEFLAHRVQSCEPSAGVLDHCSIGVGDLARSQRFYDTVLNTLGYKRLYNSDEWLGYGATKSVFWLGAMSSTIPADVPGLHFCFAAKNRSAVDEFYDRALKAGGSDNGPPGHRPEYGSDYYAAFVIDPDGYRIEAYCRSKPA